MAEIKVNPQEIRGNWRAGYALDFHTVSSHLLPDGRFDTEYTEIGKMVNRVKYHRDRSKIRPLAEIVAKFVEEEFAVAGHSVLRHISAIIPIPPSDTSRPFQPVIEIAQRMGGFLNRQVLTNYLIKTRQTKLLKNLPSVEKQAEIQGAFEIRHQDLKGRCVLLFDDLYDSGVTLTEATKALSEQGGVHRVLVLTLTQTRTKA